MASSLKTLNSTVKFTVTFYRGAVIEALMKEKQKGNLKGIYGRLVRKITVSLISSPVIFTKVL